MRSTLRPAALAIAACSLFVAAPAHAKTCKDVPSRRRHGRPPRSATNSARSAHARRRSPTGASGRATPTAGSIGSGPSRRSRRSSAAAPPRPSTARSAPSPARCSKSDGVSPLVDTAPFNRLRWARGPTPFHSASPARVLQLPHPPQGVIRDSAAIRAPARPGRAPCRRGSPAPARRRRSRGASPSWR